MSDRKELGNRVIILNGYADAEISAIMRVVKSIYSDATPEQALAAIAAARQLPEAREVKPGDLIFAKTTGNSLQMKLADLIVDMSEDHEYLRKNPPQARGGADSARQDTRS
jgi:hypothetical protein